MRTRIVFVGGVHGVGKTHFCKEIVNRFDVEHITASELIGRHINHQLDKAVLNIERNQLILAEELSRHQTRCQTILLDGHFCLLSNTAGIQDVPLETFKAIFPCAVILLVDDPEMIVNRLSNRDNFIHSTEIVSELQARETERATFISQSLGIPIIVIESTEALDESIKKIELYL